MKMKKQSILWVLLMVGLVFSSCGSRKKLVYLQDMETFKHYQITTKHEAVIHRDDKLSITVSSKNPELAIPFNISGGNFQVAADGSVISESLGSISKGYQVDVNGDIDFPILGKLHVEGLTRSRLTEMIKNRLVVENLIKEPIVLIDFMNFKISVLGEVGRNGTFTINSDRITLLEAIAMAGDLKATARTDRVAVLREDGDQRCIYMHDLRSKDIFESPCFYLQQNDIVYVEPTKYKSDGARERNTGNLSLFLSAIAALSTLGYLIFK